MASEHLVSADEVAGLLGSPTLRLADVRWYLGEPDRGRAEYDAGHIPGAVFLDLDTDLSAPSGPGRHPLPGRRAFAERMGRLGFGDDHVIVAYDASGGSVAARLWWMLRDLGHRSPRLLDGGVQAWLEAGHPTTEQVPAYGPAEMTVGASRTRSIDRDALVGRLGSATLIDVRAAERYRGEVEPVDPKGGHIPSALSVPLTENLSADGRFLPPRMLSARYRDWAKGEDTVIYCGSGVNACHTVLAMVEAGHPEPVLYPGSWSDWSSTDLPVAVGPEPGEAPS